MTSHLLFRRAILTCLLLIAASTPTHQGICQESSTATLVADGRVVEVFRSTASNNEFIVQMLVQKSEAVRTADLAGATRFPAPGEYLYVHVECADLPRPNMNIAVTLALGEHQQWIGQERPWFQELDSLDTSGPMTSGGGQLGVETEAVDLRFRRAIKVTSVSPNSPAAKAGIEVGDVLVTANGVDVASPAELAEQVRNSGNILKLTVRDIRTDKNVPVDVELGGQGEVMRNPGGNANQSSGLTTEVAFLGGNAVLKVTNVAADSPAQRAGVRKGQLILSANGNPVEKPENLAKSERNSRGMLELKLVDPQSRNERTVRLDLR